jgi:UrcA family protein
MKTRRSPRLAASYIALCAGLAISFMAGAVHAAPLDEPPSLTVNFSDLDVSKPAGAKVLYRRIQQAARVVCERYLARDARKANRERVCYETAVAGAVSRIGRREVLAVHQAANPHLQSG